MRIPLLVSALVLAILPVGSRAQEADVPRILFFTHSSGFVHDVVKRKEPGTLAHAERRLVEAARGRFEVTCSQDPKVISAEGLAPYAGIVFYTTGELPIGAEGSEALQACVRSGKGFAGIHPATDTLSKDPAYGELIRGRFAGHPWHEEVRVLVEDRRHPATAHLGEAFTITDEIYQFRDWSRDRVQVLLRLDPTSVAIEKGAREDRDYALAWCHAYGEGRVFYTALGHRPEVWDDERFLRHVVEGIAWSARLPSRAEASESANGPVLFDGSAREGWAHRDGSACRWRLEEGVLEIAAGTGDAVTRKSFGDFELHLEFMTPEHPDDVKGQDRGNSGVYLHGIYEIQVLDSFGDPPAANSCGAIYGRKAPDANASGKPGTWQTYDISFQAPRFDAAGRKVRNARVTVVHNWTCIHRDVEIDGATPGGLDRKEGPEGPILLQDHGNRVRYRRFEIRAPVKPPQ